MNGIDIANYQAGIDIEGLQDTDFVIVKVSQGMTYENEFWRDWADRVLASGRLLGLYHYASGYDVYAEADRFTSLARDYIGKALLCLDWEEGQNASWASHCNWTAPWCKRVRENAAALGYSVTPVIYVQESAAGLNDTGYPLWIAQYLYSDAGHQGYNQPDNEGAYSCAIRQYASDGRVAGYSGDLDMDVAYIDKETWMAYAGGKTSIDALCSRMYELCVTYNAYYGQGNDSFPLPRYDFREGGSFDCSSAVIKALQDAGFDTGSASWTGDMSDQLTARGWVRVGNDGNPQRGDILLNDVHHVGIWDGDHVLEHGGSCPDGYSGCNSYYDYPWSCFLRWAGSEDVKEELPMEGILWNDGTGYYICGGRWHQLTDENQLNVIRACYKELQGNSIPEVEVDGNWVRTLGALLA